MPLPTKTLGPFAGGVTDAASPLLVEGKRVVRYARNALLDGVGRLVARAGTQVALTLKDDQGSPATITSVVALAQFSDGALAVGHSTITSKFYLYWLKADLTDWYNSSKVLQGTTNVLPVGVLWTGTATPAPVTIAEGLNLGFIAHNNAGTSFKTMKFDTTVTPATLTAFQANLDGAGVADTYFRGVVSFQQHLWAWGFGSATAGDNDRPELLRFSTPFFGAMAQTDNFAVGHEVRSVRERVVAAVVSGSTLYVGTNFSIWPVVGFGRNSWDKSRPIDEAYGFAGLFSACAGPNGYLYYWSHRGPMRVLGYGPPEPLWPRVAATIVGVVNEQTIVAAYDPNVDQVVWLYQDGTSGRVSRLCAYDVIREAILGPDGDVGLGVAAMAFIAPVFGTLAAGPVGAPTTPTTDGVGTTVATAHWVNGDTSPETLTQVEYRTPQGSGAWTVASATIPSGTTSFQITGLAGTTPYEWRAKHIRNGISSAYLGPVAGTQFTTIAQLNPPTNCVASAAGPYEKVTWTNSGESGVSTEVWWGKQGLEVLVGTSSPGISSYYVINPFAGGGGTYDAKVRHVRAGSTSSTFAISNQVFH